MCTGLENVVLRPKILGNRLGILTQILIAMHYFSSYIYFREVPSTQKKTKAFVRKIFGSPHTSNRIYFAQNFPCNEFNFGLFIACEEQYYVLRFFKLSVKVTFKQAVKNPDYLIFLIFFVFTIVFFLELETKEGGIVQRVHLFI